MEKPETEPGERVSSVRLVKGFLAVAIATHVFLIGRAWWMQDIGQMLVLAGGGLVLVFFYLNPWTAQTKLKPWTLEEFARLRHFWLVIVGCVIGAIGLWLH